MFQNTGLFLYDDNLGLITIARGQDSLLASQITQLTLARGGLNDLGQVAFRFQLFDGREGIALVTVPEPASLGVIALVGLAAMRRRRA